KGDGTFIDAGSYSPSVSGAQIQTLCSADFNRDGIPDVAADFWYDVGSQDLMLLTGQAGGGFSAADSNLAGDQTYEMITADMNGDSIPDLVVILDRALVIGLGLGDGGFAWGLPIGNLGIPRGLTVGDYGQIGSLQIAVADNA